MRETSGGVLTGEANYKTWVRSIRITLGSDVFNYITTGNTPSSFFESDSSGWEDYTIKTINAAIDPVKILSLLLEIPDDQVLSHAYWIKLQNRFAPKDTQGSLRLISQFWQIPSIPTTEDGFDTWADGATALVRDMRTAKIDFEQLVSSHLLANLPPAFESFRAAFDLNLSNQDPNQTKTPKFKDIISLLRIQVRRPGTQTIQSAYFSSLNPIKINIKGNRTRIDYSKPPSTTCPACKSGFHWARDCNDKEKKDNYYLKRLGNKTTANVATNPQSLNNSNSNNDIVGFIASAFLSVQVSNFEFILDSGATNHMSNNKRFFSSLKLTSLTKVGGIAGSLDSIGIGNIDMITLIGTTIRLSNVLYIPDLPLNLISVVYLQTIGISTLFEVDTVKLFKNNHLVCTGTQMDNGLCKLDASVTLKNIDSRLLAHVAINSKHTPLSVLHQRFGHLSVNSIRKTFQVGFVDGIERSNSEEEVSKFKCNSCISSKSHRIPSEDSESHTSKPLELVHSDVLTFPTASLSGKRYLVTFVDNHSRKVWVSAIGNKSDVFSAFQIWKNEVEKISGHKTKTLRSDNGSEYTSNLFNTFSIKHAIHLSFTIPYTSQQNGRADRLNLSIVEGVLALLDQSGLPGMLWAGASHYFIDSKNINPHAGINGKVPSAVWNGSKPDVSTLRVFGCRAWLAIPNHEIGSTRTKSLKSLITITNIQPVSTNQIDSNDKISSSSSPFMANNDTHNGYNSLEPPSQDPRNWNEAIRSGHEDIWRQAAKEKFNSLLNEYSCFTPIDIKSLPQNSKILGSRFVFRTKRDQHGNITKHKGRLVAQGVTQRPGIDFNETFAPVAKFTSIRTF